MKFIQNLFSPKKPENRKVENIISTSPAISELKKQSGDGLKFPTKPIDWETKITDRFYVEKPIFFVDEQEIIIDLKTARLESLSVNMKWNLSLCLAYGSDELARATAIAIFKVIQQEDKITELRWMANTMLNTGDSLSGIDWEGGIKGLKTLLEICPEKHRNQLRDLIVNNTNYDIAYSYNPKQDESKSVVFMQETKKPDPYGIALATYRVYRGDSKKAAYDFLTKNIVKEKMLFLVVETPDGNFCRDVCGIYKER